MSDAPTVSAIAPWFGSFRMLAAEVGRELAGCSWVGVTFAGGMCELAHIDARTMMVNDLHRAVINYARVVKDARLGPMLYRRVRRTPFHPEALVEAQAFCRMVETEVVDTGDDLFYPKRKIDMENPEERLRWAEAYHIAAWMPRHGTSGTTGEFNTGISTRWTASGGDSAAHFRGATQSLVTWRKILRRANFTTLDFRDFVGKCKNEAGVGIYCDPPFPGPGDSYKHKFTQDDHRDLAARLSLFTAARVVCRFYDHPFVRELYPQSRWTWRSLKGRKQTNDEAPEVLLINGASYAK